MNAEERALLAAIIAHPDEDTPRLVYADWLQEHDRSERAEYIRLSIQLANLRYGDPTFHADEQRILALRSPLVERFFATWESEFAGQFPANRDVSFHFERGIVTGVSCSVKYFLDNGDRLFRAAPLCSLIPRTLTPATAKRLVASPLFRRLKELKVWNVSDAQALLGCETVEIDTLNFSQTFFYSSGQWDAVAVVLAGHAGLKSVRRIGFENCGLDDDAGRALAGAPHFKPNVLNLLGNTFTEPVRQALRKRYGPRVWIDRADRNGFPRRF